MGVEMTAKKGLKINKWKLGIGLIFFPNGWASFFSNEFTGLIMLCNLAFLISVYLICNSVELK